MNMMFMLAQVGWALIPTDNYTEKKIKETHLQIVPLKNKNGSRET
jgi:hypothetical protein